jgi:hypothetical protein
MRRRSDESYCCECDAPRGGCAHTGPRYLLPIAYNRLGETEDGRPIWGVPEPEKWRCANPPSTWARAEQRRPSSDPSANPFHCVGCGAPLGAFARMRGYTHCTVECRKQHG